VNNILGVFNYKKNSESEVSLRVVLVKEYKDGDTLLGGIDTVDGQYKTFKVENISGEKFFVFDRNIKDFCLLEDVDVMFEIAVNNKDVFDVLSTYDIVEVYHKANPDRDLFLVKENLWVNLEYETLPRTIKATIGPANNIREVDVDLDKFSISGVSYNEKELTAKEVLSWVS
jgi:hypothetical protein